MPREIVIERDYAMEADAHFACVVRFDELAEAMAGQVRYEGMPEGEAVKGQSIDLRLFLYGWLPMGRWHIDVIDRDDAERLLESREHGGVAKRHDHVLTVTPLPGGGCRHRDHLIVDAGLMTAFYARSARRMYEKRHDLRQALRAGQTA
ncbi:MAG: hypothetical protein CMF74_03935 [Maricaulis sp.]|nr:hypothetical protein [Maricaulis sp.]HAQ34308.1 hypothetical protein [Alphaproteobacteria bacterium]